MPAWRCESHRGLRPPPAPRADARPALADRAADRLLDRRGDLGRTRNGDSCRMSITADQEQTAVDAVPTQLFIGGEWRDATGGATLDVEDPSTGETIAAVADATPEDADGRARRRVRRAGRVGRAPAARARRDPAPRVRGDHRARRRARAGHDARDGQAARGVEGRDRLRVGVLPLVRRGGGADRGPLRDRAERRRAADHDAPARRPLLRDHAVELPDGDGHAQDRPGDRRRLHDGDQAGAADAAVDARAGRDPRGGRAARPACSTSSPRSPRATSRSRSSATRGCASSPSPARPRSAASSSSSPPRACCARRWSWAATRRSSSSPTPTSTPRSRAR